MYIFENIHLFILGSRVIKSDRVYEAMSAVDRANYTHPSYAYIDSPQSIGYGATISAPHMVYLFLNKLIYS